MPLSRHMYVCMYCYVPYADHVVLYVLLLLLLPYYPLHLNMQQSSMGLDLFLILDCYGVLPRSKEKQRSFCWKTVVRTNMHASRRRMLLVSYSSNYYLTFSDFSFNDRIWIQNLKILVSLYIYIHIHAQDSRQNPQHIVRANHESISKYMTSTLLYHASQLQLAREHREKDTVSYQSS